MTQPLITIDADAKASAPRHVRDWVQQVAKGLARNGDGPPHLWPYRYEGHEHLCCDYKSFSITFIVTGGETKLFEPSDAQQRFTDMEVHDMTEALMLVSRIEMARTGKSTVTMG